MDTRIAQYFLAIDFEPDDIDRMNFLAERARQGNLSSEEDAELRVPTLRAAMLTHASS
jgi:hypothetical protein